MLLAFCPAISECLDREYLTTTAGSESSNMYLFCEMMREGKEIGSIRFSSAAVPYNFRLNMLCAPAWAAVLAEFILGRLDCERMSKSWLKGR